jgi:hypothetical protein
MHSNGLSLLTQHSGPADVSLNLVMWVLLVHLASILSAGLMRPLPQSSPFISIA